MRESSFSEPLLFVGDPHLGERQGWNIVRRYFPQAQKMIWKKGESKAACQKFLRQQFWPVTISFYSDYIFYPEEFAHLNLVLNLHPALPQIRGIGHDHLPLIEGHRHHGGTLHFIEGPAQPGVSMADQIDTGRIIRIKTQPLHPAATYGDLRQANQAIMLEMLHELCVQLQSGENVATANAALRQEAQQNQLAWGMRYIGHQELNARLQTLRGSAPHHQVFNPKRSPEFAQLNSAPSS